MKKIIYGVLAIVVVGIISVGFINSDNIDDESPFKIGLVLPLSGGASFLGESAQKAAQLAIKDAGETKYNYELLFEDDGFSPVKTVSAVNKLINVDNVSALVTFGSGTSNAVAQINEDAQVTRFGLASDPVSVEGDYNFIHWTPAYKEGELLAQELVNRGYKKVSIVDTNHSGTLAVTNSVRESLASTDVEVVSYDLTNVGDTDFRTMAQKIKNNESEIVVLSMFSPEIEVLTRQFNELGVIKPITAVETFEWSSEPELFEGLWFVSDSAVSAEFAAHYFDNFDVEPRAGATYVYDIVSMLIDVQEASNNRIEAKDLAGIISGMGSYDSSLFGNIEITEEGYVVTEASVKMIKNGVAVPVK